MNTEEYDAWSELILHSCTYGALTGGRFLPENFSETTFTKSSRSDDEDLKAAILEAKPAVELYRTLAKIAAEDGDADVLLNQYREAYQLTLHEAALKTMAAALKALGLYPSAVAKKKDMVIVDVDFLKTAPFEKIVQGIHNEVERHAADLSASAKLRAASFIADFGMSTGLGRVACSDAEEILAAFYERLSQQEEGKKSKTELTGGGFLATISSLVDEKGEFQKKCEVAMQDAFAPYASLFDGSTKPRKWCQEHPDEALSLGVALGGLALGVGIAAISLMRGGGRNSRRR